MPSQVEQNVRTLSTCFSTSDSMFRQSFSEDISYLIRRADILNYKNLVSILCALCHNNIVNFFSVATIYKNQLQEYTQKAGKRLPIYQYFNEGSENFPRHRAKVLVDGVEYTSKLTHSTKKQAEQEVAKIAYESIFHEEAEVVSFLFLYKVLTLYLLTPF
ncbi:hypothetical protein H5410_018719 [Solanum commersonii]|uniref:DRBM domain-containing protein n=1 Tax=Solanum commersonii TaxID=4109 RepID=A0A9J6A467_SOLCO|nr:hypothetical protein H5410_018719 [Solanum commersonii]